MLSKGNGTVALALMLAISGCTNLQEITSPPVDVQFASNAAQQEVAGYWSTEVRTMVGQAPYSEELVGASCELTGTGFSASFTTPALVNLPHWAQTSRAVNVTCTLANVSGSKNVTAYNKTVSDINDRANSTAREGGLIGAIVGGIIAGSAARNRDQSKDTWAYRTISVDMKD